MLEIVSYGLGDAPLRTKQEALADLEAKFRGLPLTHPARGRLALMIVGLEDAIAAEVVPGICPFDRRVCRTPRCAICPVGSAAGAKTEPAPQ